MCDCVDQHVRLLKLIMLQSVMAAVPAATCFRAALPTDQSILNYMCKVTVSVVPELKMPSLPRISPGFYVYLRSFATFRHSPSLGRASLQIRKESRCRWLVHESGRIEPRRGSPLRLSNFRSLYRKSRSPQGQLCTTRCTSQTLKKGSRALPPDGMPSSDPGAGQRTVRPFLAMYQLFMWSAGRNPSTRDAISFARPCSRAHGMSLARTNGSAKVDRRSLRCALTSQWRRQGPLGHVRQTKSHAKLFLRDSLNTNCKAGGEPTRRSTAKIRAETPPHQNVPACRALQK